MLDMLYGFHVILSTYGFWLPNDPRGSWSDFVRNWELRLFGPATKVQTRQSVAANPHDHAVRQAAKAASMYPEVKFTGKQALSVANGFRQAVEESEYLIHACSILPQHVHLVFGPHKRDIRRIVGHLRGRATQQLQRDGLHPLLNFRKKDGTVPSPWGRGSWTVFIYSEEHMRAAIKYVNDNPLKEGKLRQKWSFVQPYSFEEAVTPARSKLRR
jgi:REP element-mobilizing transposase RayT